MKKTIALVACLLLLLGTAVSANSGPTYWEQAPSFSMTALKDCPVTVEREDLSFDFSSNEHFDYSPKAEVTAAYQMKNPTKSALRVQMAFPLIGTLFGLSSTAGVRITADGKNIPFQVFMGDNAAQTGMTHNYYGEDGSLNAKNLSFDQILNSVSENAVPLQKMKDKGKQYRFSSGGKSCSLKVNFEIDPKKTAILCNGFNGFSFDKNGDGKIELRGFLSEGEQTPMNFLVMGDDIKDLTVGAYKSGSDTEKMPDVVPKTDTSSQNTELFIKEMLHNTSQFAEQLLPAVEKQIDAKISAGQTVVDDSIVADLCNENHIIVLAYEIPFAANSVSNVSVRYSMGGAMDEKTASQPVYSYGYLLNPAKGWAKFSNLNIAVTPPKLSPYVIKSSVALTRAGDGTYSAKLSTLPKIDLAFTLYAKPQITPDDKPANKKLTDSTKFLLVLAAGIILVSLISFFIKQRKRKSKH